MNKCGHCAGALYTDTDHYGTHETCRNCGRTRVVELSPETPLWHTTGAGKRPRDPLPK